MLIKLVDSNNKNLKFKKLEKFVKIRLIIKRPQKIKIKIIIRLKFKYLRKEDPEVKILKMNQKIILKSNALNCYQIHKIILLIIMATINYYDNLK